MMIFALGSLITLPQISSTQAISIAQGFAVPCGTQFSRASATVTRISRPDGEIVIVKDGSRRYTIADNRNSISAFEDFDERMNKSSGSSIADETLVAKAVQIRNLLQLDSTYEFVGPARIRGCTLVVRFEQRVFGTLNQGVGNFATISINRFSGKLAAVSCSSEFTYAQRDLQVNEASAISKAKAILSQFYPSAPISVTNVSRQYLPPGGPMISAYGRELLAERKLVFGYVITFKTHFVMICGKTGKCVGGS